MSKFWLSLVLTLSMAQSIAAPLLTGNDIVSGKPISLAQYKNQTVLLVFFSAGCTTCVYNFKLIREFYKANRASHFGVIGVGLDSKPGLFRSYAELVRATTPKDEQFPLLWRLGATHRDGFGELKNDSTVFVISKNGEITLKREGVIKDDDWDEIWTSLQAN
ncbi:MULTISPECIES: peroxiredoxin family protein [Deefgea]|uniref:Redoxin domain-containing protein n=1 Tax=Deefgea chitinilytica TaxID=570276 RepID=A0ABS2C8V9_9NEIS|nr:MULTISPECIES: redoxin domain-containing protein [Deefgea]MBM5570070.1 redoxin domain-containing protein [Deefgea chitinilytica]MBM9887299.1 redoxin domain-containing protein [Deefgea sp. CFH1-16]